MEKYLPLGTVVLLKDATKRLMIYGRRQLQAGTNKEFDYSGVLFPEGYINDDTTYLFNHEQIEHVFQMGFRNREDILYLEKVLTKIGR